MLAGAATSGCIRATAHGALDRGYDVTLVEDGHVTGSIDLAADRRIEAADIVDELNVAMKRLDCPGRRKTTARAELVAFVAPTEAR